MDNTFRVGTVCKSDGMSVDIDLQGAVLKGVPMAGVCNSFMKAFIPAQVGEQVMVLAEDGDLDKAYAVATLPSKEFAPPSGGNSGKAIIEIGGIALEMEGDTLTLTAGTLKLEGDLDVNGSITTTEDITAEGVITDSDGNNGA